MSIISVSQLFRPPRTVRGGLGSRNVSSGLIVGGRKAPVPPPQLPGGEPLSAGLLAVPLPEAEEAVRGNPPSSPQRGATTQPGRPFSSSVWPYGLLSTKYILI